MKRYLKHVFAGLLIILGVLYIFKGITTWGDVHLVQLKIMVAAFLSILLLSVLLFRETMEKIRNLRRRNVELTRGFVYCLSSLPILWYLLDVHNRTALINWQIFFYLLTLLLAILNYGIKVRDIVDAETDHSE